MRCELVSWAQVRSLSRRLVSLIRSSSFQPDTIVAIGRGGYMPARLLSDYLDVYDLTSFKIEHYRRAHRQAEARVRYPLSANVAGKQLLLVDDVSDAGDTFELALAHLADCGPPARVRTAALHHKRGSRFTPDYFAVEITEWRWLIYPWAILEDVSGFIRELSLVDAPLAKIKADIQRSYGVRVSDQVLRDARELARRARPNEP
jgi:hypoxanthine phosphoribosyltransferase